MKKSMIWLHKFVKGEIMKLVKMLFCTTMLIGTMVFTGCSNVVRPSISQSEFILNGEKVNSTVALHITDEYRNFKGKHVDWWCDATSYTMEIGPLATDWFRYSFESQFERVNVNSGLAKFPYSVSDVDFVVTPEFTSFKAGGPVIIKLEKYWVELGMTATIQDKSGKVLDTLELKEKGSKGGTPGFNPGTDLYPEICREAVRPLVEKTTNRLIELSKQN
jgi:hypothetical protein